MKENFGCAVVVLMVVGFVAGVFFLAFTPPTGLARNASYEEAAVFEIIIYDKKRKELVDATQESAMLIHEIFVKYTTIEYPKNIEVKVQNIECHPTVFQRTITTGDGYIFKSMPGFLVTFTVKFFIAKDVSPGQYLINFRQKVLYELLENINVNERRQYVICSPDLIEFAPGEFRYRVYVGATVTSDPVKNEEKLPEDTSPKEEPQKLPEDLAKQIMQVKAGVVPQKWPVVPTDIVVFLIATLAQYILCAWFKTQSPMFISLLFISLGILFFLGSSWINLAMVVIGMWFVHAVVWSSQKS